MRYTLEHLESMLRIDKHDLDTAVEEHSEIAGIISREVAAAEYNAEQAADELKQVEARILMGIKLDATVKITADEAKAMVARHPDRKEPFREALRLAELHKRWQGMADAWRGRGFGIRVLADLYTASYFMNSTSTKAHPRRDYTVEDPPPLTLRRRPLTT